MAQEIYSETLPNGLTLIAERMDWLGSAAFTLAVPAGNTRDPIDRLGLANFTAEMLQRGCGTRDSRAFVEALDRLGADRSSAVTSAHATFSLATLAEHLIPALAIHADLVQRPHLPEAQLEDARQVCQLELQALEDDVAQMAMLRLRKESYPDPWGRSSLGTAEALQQITHRDVQQFHAQMYTPQETLLGIAGKFDWPRVRDAVAELFGEWQGTKLPSLEVGPAGPVNVHVPRDSSQTQVAVSFESVPFRHPDYIQARATVGVLSDGMSSRLFTEIREERGLCYTVYAHHHSFRDTARVLCYAGTSAERAQETLDVLLAELHRLKAGIGQDELSRLKARTKSALIMQQESSAARSSALIGDWYHLGRVRDLNEIHALVESVTCESVWQFLQQHPPGNYTVVTFGRHPLEIRNAVPTSCAG